MWQRFTTRARRVVFFAQEEAAEAGENYVGTEHLLLGLVREYDSAAGRILTAMGVDQAAIQTSVRQQMTRGKAAPRRDMQITPRSKRTIDLAYEEAQRLKNNYIGTEHLLLGLVREGEGLGAKVLRQLGVEIERLRPELERLQQSQQPSAGPSPQERPRDVHWEPMIGDVGVLRPEDGRAHVEFVLAEEALEEMWEVWVTQDHHGYLELVSSGRMLVIPTGTRVKLLRTQNPNGFYVRLLSGAHEGRAGWVRRSHFENQGPDERPFPPIVEEPAPAERPT